MTEATAITEGLARFTGRGPATDAERRAASWLHDELRASGHEAWVETLWLRPQWALSLALHATVGVIASLVAVTAPLPALIAAGVTALSLAIEATGRAGPLRWILPRRATQNVLVPAEDDDEAVTLLICARYDAARGGFVTRDRVRRFGERLPGGPRVWVAAACALVAACAGARLAGVEGVLLGVAQFIPTLVLLFALAAAADVTVAGIGPGDNDTGVGVALALHDELTRDTPEHLSPALLLYGAGDGGPAALRAHIRREKLDPRRTVVLELGPCDAGEPAYAAAHSGLRAACAAAGGRRVPARGVAAGRRPPAAWIGCVDTAYARACADEIDAAIAA